MLRTLGFAILLLASSTLVSAQNTSTTRLIPYSGTVTDVAGAPLTGEVSLTFELFEDEEGGTPLWREMQRVHSDQAGRYLVYLGNVTPVPQIVFSEERARWLAVNIEGRPLPRVMLVAVPYALRAADADTLGGQPASSFVQTGSDGRLRRADGTAIDTASVDGIGVPNQLAKWAGATSLGSSIIGESLDNRVGINTTDPTGGGVVDALVTLRSIDNKTGFAILNQSHAPRFAVNTLPLGGWTLFDGSSNQWYQGLTQTGGRVTLGITPPVFGARLSVIQHDTDSSAIFARKRTANADATAILGRSAPGLPGPIVAGVAGTEGTVVADTGVLGVNNNTNGIGVLGYAPVAGGIGVQGNGTAYGGYFIGNVHVTGTLTKGGGSFTIDHPLDPANKILQHSFVESPDMMNVYNGNVTLDASGEAWVTLPDWFQALNRDFRYQLTSIGSQASPYVAVEVSDNRFKIAGGTPDGKVSWQVTGIRQDAWANAHRIAVETDKPPSELGSYLHPKELGQTESAATPSIQRSVIDASQKSAAGKQK